MKKEQVSVVNKSMSSDDESNGIRDGEIDLINKFTRRKLKKEEVYVFSVVLCDNEVDRQSERFSDESLIKLAELFVGKTGIMDHDVKSGNQTARIFACEVRTSEEKVNSEGKPYKYLVARAYMPKTEGNQEVIMAIDSGIKKEVSINCAVENIKCSICGSNIKTTHCRHIKGKKYNKGNFEILCHYVLEDPIDAYEWSFVVVPAQREAGVIKAFSPESRGGEVNMQDIVKRLSLGGAINLSETQVSELYEVIKSLKEKAEIGEEYFKELKNEVMRLSASVQPEIDVEIMKGIVEKMSLNELKSFKDAYKKKIVKSSAIKPQLSRNVGKSRLNTQFKI